MKRTLIALILILCFIPININAAPAYPYPVEYELPDGSTVTIQLGGDEFINWQESDDGYTVLFNADGYLEYAETSDDGDLKLSGIRVRNERDRSDKEKEFLRKKNKHMRYSPSQLELMQSIEKVRSEMEDDIQLAVNATGTVRVPIILVAFKEKPFTKSVNDFKMLFDQKDLKQIGTATYPGSLRDYFELNSSGKMDFRVDVYGPYTLPNQISYYGGDNGLGGNSPGNGGMMARAAVDSAARNGCDFSKYSSFTDANTVIPHIIFAGYGTEAGGAKPGSIWSHASSFSSVTYNGKKLSRYSCSPELRGNSGTTLANIGVVAHELGHSLFGLPDFYQTNSDLGQAVDLQDWDVMAGGVWNDNARTPAKFSAYSRVFNGWVTETVINSPKEITVPNPASQDVVYRINTKTNNEYYLLENRQKSHWEGYVYGSGLLVYHVDRTNTQAWNNNKVNVDPNKRLYYVKQAGQPNYSRNNRQTDPYPQPKNNEITDFSAPNMRSWAGANTDMPITNITHNTSAGTISFTAGSGGGQQPTLYTASLDRNDGSGTVTTVTQTTQGGTVALPALTRNGYTHNGWTVSKDGTGTPYTGNVVITSNITLYAKWTAILYTATLNNNDGSNTTKTVSQTKPGGTIALPVLTREGYKHNGWCTTKECTGTAYTGNVVIISNITLYAKWTPTGPVLYTATLDYNDSSSIVTIVTQNTVGGTVTLPVLTRNGYIHDGWYENKEGTGELYTGDVVITSNITLYAKWMEVTVVLFTANLDHNDGTDSVSIVTQTTLGGTVTLPILARSGYTHDGWYENKESTGELYTGDVVITSNITLYAKWSEETAIHRKNNANDKTGILLDNAIVSDVAKFEVKTAKPSQINLQISDNLGNVVFETSGKSSDKFIWELTNKAGRFVANGSYLVIAEAVEKGSGRVYVYYSKVGVKR
jgi:M6 family metalloprotease-like protein/uncharacterized repeat protein (TIGR02543 family)